MLKVMSTKKLKEQNGGKLVPFYVHDEKGYLCKVATACVEDDSRIKCYIDGKKYYTLKWVY